jgi:translocation and assembly module TamB
VIVRWLAAAVLAVLIAVLGLVAFVTGTERGTAWLAARAESLSGGAVQLEAVQGSIVSGLRVGRVTVRAGDTTITGDTVVLQVHVAALLARRIAIAELRIARLAIQPPDRAIDVDEPFRMPAIAAPWAVGIERLQIDQLRIGAGDSVTVITNLYLRGGLTGTRLEAHELRATVGPLAARVAGTAELHDRLPLELAVQWRLSAPALSGVGTLRGDLAELALTQWLRVPDEIAIEGRLLDVVDAPRIDAVASWQTLGVEVAGLGMTRAEGGRLRVAGWLDDWRGQIGASLAAPSLPPARVRATLHGSDRLVVVDELRLDGRFGILAARGEIGLQAPQRLRLAITARNIDTAAFRAGLTGRLAARADLDAELPGAVRLRFSGLDGRLMERPVAGSGEIGYRDGMLRFDGVDLRAGANRLRADGRLGERLAGTFTLEAPQLAVLWPGLDGSLSARAVVAGSVARPVVELDATGRSLTLDGNGVAALEVHGSADQSGRVDARVRAQGIRAGAYDLGSLVATLAGTLEAHRFSAALTGGLADAHIDSAGAWAREVLRHRISSARVLAQATGEWRLRGEPELELGAASFSLGPHCWEQAPAALCFTELAGSAGRSRVAAELRDLDLQRFAEWLPEDLAVTGRAEAAVALESAAAAISGTAAIRLADAIVYYTGGDEPLVSVLRNAALDLQFTPEAATAALDLASDTGLRLAGSGRMAAPLGEAAAIDAAFRGEIPEIAPLLPVLAPDLDLAEVRGRITLDAAVAGTLRAPEWTGVARLSGGAAALADVGVKFEDIDISLLGDGSATLRLQGAARAGGPLTLAGALSPLEEGGPQGWLRLRGNGIDAVRLPDRLVQASPDITVRYEAGRVSTEGSISIPKANIVIRALPESAASPSADAVVRDRDAAARSQGQQPIGGEVALILGRNVRLRAFGLDTLLEGTLKLSQAADGEPRGYGVVRLREGKFGAYSKELTIERGTLGFSGPLDDPVVDIRASRRIDWEGQRVTAGLQLSGTATRPESRVFAEPAMSEADALSYLIAGRPMRSTSEGDRSAISGAALSFGLMQASPITEGIGSAVALDEFGVEAGSVDETEVVAGKQLGSDFYVRFTYGVFSRIGTVIARYKLGRNVSIEASSGADQSLDLIYSVERE